MSLVPEFEIGIWNAWILMVWLLVPFFLEPLNIIPKGREQDSNLAAELNKLQKSTFLAFHIIFLLMVIYSIFLPIKLGTVWFYSGLSIYLLGFILYVMVFVGFATTSPNKPVTKGIYRYSRHPMYITSFVVFIGMGIASASWLFLLLSFLFIILVYYSVVSEERFCLKYYGNSYREYMNKTPRWIGIPK